MSITDDFNSYSDQFGLVQPEPNSTSGNGLLYTGEAMVALHDNDAITTEVAEFYEKVYQNCEKVPGLMIRAPKGKDDQEGPDDYHGCGLFSSYIDDGALAKRILAYGQNRCKTFDPAAEDASKLKTSKLIYTLLSIVYLGRGIPYVYNNVNEGRFTLSAWMGRFPALIAHLKIAAGIKPNLLERLWWCVSLLIPTAKDNHDGWILSWCRVRAWRKRGLLEKVAVWWWRRKFKATWDSPGDLLSAYFVNPNHPLSVYLKGSE